MEAVAAEVGWMNRERPRTCGQVMALLARDLHLALGTGNEEFEHARILEYYRYSAYGTATVLPAHDDGTEYGLVDTGVYSGSGQDDGSGSHLAWDGVEVAERAMGVGPNRVVKQNPLSLDDNNALMLARRNGSTHSGSNVPTSRDYSIPGARGESYGRVSQFGNFTTFTGRRLDTTTGLMYYRYRYYESVSGRFVGNDPLGYSNGFNTLQYAHSSPAAGVDQMGLAATFLGSDAVSMPGEWKTREPVEQLDILNCWTTKWVAYGFSCADRGQDLLRKLSGLDGYGKTQYLAGIFNLMEASLGPGPDCKCVKNFTFVGHGNAEMFALYTRTEDAEKVRAQDAWLFGRKLRNGMSDMGVVNLMVCLVGRNGRLQKELAEGAMAFVQAPTVTSSIFPSDGEWLISNEGLFGYDPWRKDFYWKQVGKRGNSIWPHPHDHGVPIYLSDVSKLLSLSYMGHRMRHFPMDIPLTRPSAAPVRTTR